MMGYSYSYSVKIMWFFLFIFVGVASSQTAECPFHYLYHFGDGVQDIGNSIKIGPSGPSLPAAHLPYGISFPGYPTGRWSDGRVDIDYIASRVGIEITPYVSQNATTSKGVIFSVDSSPVLNRTFFASRNVTIQPYAIPLNDQLNSFKDYLKSICSSPTDCTSRLRDSLILMGDIQANDIGYPLTQGKSIQEVQSYVPIVTGEVENATRELIEMGATRIVIPGNAPLGCYPYILTALPSNDPAAYDDLGCLKSVNNLIVSKNNDIQKAVLKLKIEFPKVDILYAPYYEAVRTVILGNHITGSRNTSLSACCGIGGKYNYDGRRFCGSQGVPVCPNPNQYTYWDGLHFTQEAYRRVVDILITPALLALQCIP